MNLSEEQKNRFSELEYCFGKYFDSMIAPVMQEVQRDLICKQARELADYQSSPAGIITMATDPLGCGTQKAMQTLDIIGEWNSKTTDDYLDMCRKKIEKSDTVSGDLNLLAGEWRKHIIETIGRDKYDVLSNKLGTDLANAYVSYRMEHSMIDRLVQQKIPKSSLEYILKKASDQSLLSIPYSLRQTAIDNDIERAAERKYGPTLIEKGAGKVLGFGMDTVATGGFSTWANAGKAAMLNIVVDGVEFASETRRDNLKPPSVEEYISRGVFQTKQNVIGGFRQDASHIEGYKNDYIQSLNGELGGRLKVLTLAEKEELDRQAKKFERPKWEPEFSLEEEKEWNPDVPMMIHPDAEERYLNENKNNKEYKGLAAEGEKKVEQSGEYATLSEQGASQPSRVENHENGWGNLLGSFGLSDIGGVGKNLGYIVSMLPNLFLGLFTGKTKSLGLKDNLLPIASVLLGLFTKNPMLKMLLIGMGGLNLLNKAGHETINNKKVSDGVPIGETEPVKKEYKRYADEQLNPRIVNPEIKGNCLLAMIDNVPCTIQIPETAVAAYHAGALPLNTLANAILAKSDEMQSIAQEKYAESEDRTIRSRGVGG